MKWLKNMHDPAEPMSRFVNMPFEMHIEACKQRQLYLLDKVIGLPQATEWSTVD